jgi:two-component system cell cycle response regulator DivK
VARILIVEDNPQNMKLAAFLLEGAGHEVLQATDARTGIELARAHRPELILMDIQLPGMDGLTATRLLKENGLSLNSKVYALTAFAMKGDEEKMRTAGCDGYIAKPIRYREFLETIETALAGDGGTSVHGT